MVRWAPTSSVTTELCGPGKRITFLGLIPYQKHPRWPTKISQALSALKFNYGGNTAGLVCVLHTLPGPRRGCFPFLLFHCLDWVSLDRFPLWFSFALSVRKKRFHGPPACWGCPWGSCDLCLLPSPSQKLAEKEVAGALSEEGDWLDAGLQAIHT